MAQERCYLAPILKYPELLNEPRHLVLSPSCRHASEFSKTRSPVPPLQYCNREAVLETFQNMYQRLNEKCLQGISSGKGIHAHHQADSSHIRCQKPPFCIRYARVAREQGFASAIVNNHSKPVQYFRDVGPDQLDKPYLRKMSMMLA